MAWEDNVTRVCAAGRPRSVYELGLRWNSLAQALNQVGASLDNLGRRTENDGTATPKRTMPGPVEEHGNRWDGVAADAFRAFVQKLVQEFSELEDQSYKVGGSLIRCADALSVAVSKTPVPLFWDRDLPGGVDVEDLINGKALDKDTGTEFAQRLNADTGRGAEYYRPDGFKKRVDDMTTSTGDGVAKDGKQQGGTPGSWWGIFFDTDGYHKERDAWYNANQGTSQQAYDALVKAYQDEYGNVSPSAMSNTPYDERSPFGDNDSKGPGGGGPSAGYGGSPRMPGSAAGSGFSPSGFAPPDSSYDGSSTETGLAGAGDLAGGQRPPGLADGLGGGGLGGGGLGGGAGSGGGGLGRAGLGGGGISGMVSPGSASAGPGRAPTPPLTDPVRGMPSAAGRGAGGAAGTGMGMGMMPGGAGGRGAGGEDRDSASWLLEDDDVWGSGHGGQVPPGGLIGREFGWGTDR